ncbi:hypothetical protein [Streptomyces sp. NBC_01618]|uniref:hypothetical protein n=1 Tax=Streptomyces sp. NBC_01618 TaxID=2975900 RepID=UPI0038693809|nr:hypothetical protein OH735_12015 [Streptomyces sp. NBC_01618]
MIRTFERPVGEPPGEQRKADIMGLRRSRRGAQDRQDAADVRPASGSPDLAVELRGVRMAARP